MSGLAAAAQRVIRNSLPGTGQRCVPGVPMRVVPAVVPLAVPVEDHNEMDVTVLLSSDDSDSPTDERAANGNAAYDTSD